ncbi:MAG: oligosaccharide flippase family protein, partial [Thermoguttaceae bacterium]|nr:oligosaccharide flippase family protein [Thermoguttaceae bacterium]
MKNTLLRLLQGAGFSCGTLFVGILFGLFLTPYTLTSLGERSYGIYVFASLFAGWCGLLDFGLTASTSRFVTHYFALGDRRAIDEIGSTAIVLFGGIASIVSLLASGAFVVVAARGNEFGDAFVVGETLFFAGASFAVSKFSDGVNGVVKGVLRQELAEANALIFRILFGVVSFGVLFCGGKVVALAVGNFALTALKLCADVAILRVAAPEFRFSLKNVRKDRARTLFGYSFFTFLAQIGEMAIGRSDLLVISACLSLADVARYNLVVVTLTSYFTSFVRETANWQTNWFAKLAAEDDAERPGAARFRPEFYASRAAIGKAWIYFSFFLAFGILAFGRAFVERWIGAEYLSVFPALALYVAVVGLYRGSAETNSRLLQGLAR